MSEIEVAELGKENYRIWDQLVDESPYGTVFHKSTWLNTCAELNDRRLKIYGCFENQRLVGGCALFIHTVNKLLKIGSSVCNMMPYGGLVLLGYPEVSKQESKSAEIIRSLSSAISDDHYDRVWIVNSPDFIDIRPFTMNRWENKVFYAYYLYLEQESGIKVSKKAKEKIKKAIRSGIVIKKSNDISSYYELFSMTFERQNLATPVSKSFFSKILNLLWSAGLGEMWIAEMPTGEAASAEIVMWDSKRAYSVSAASHSEWRKTGSSSLLIYELSEKLRKKNFAQWNQMMGNTPQLSRYISNFNPSLVPYFGVGKSNLKYDAVKILIDLKAKRYR